VIIGDPSAFAVDVRCVPLELGDAPVPYGVLLYHVRGVSLGPHDEDFMQAQNAMALTSMSAAPGGYGLLPGTEIGQIFGEHHSREIIWAVDLSLPTFKSERVVFLKRTSFDVVLARRNGEETIEMPIEWPHAQSILRRASSAITEVITPADAGTVASHAIPDKHQRQWYGISGGGEIYIYRRSADGSLRFVSKVSKEKWRGRVPDHVISVVANSSS
jgi:hypothetical protein